MNEQGIISEADAKNFFAWQCRIRQEAMRLAAGRPSQGMFARIAKPENCRDASIIFLLQRKDAENYVAQFRFIVASCLDPQERRERGLKVLASSYYQNSPMFLPIITATFAHNSALPERLLQAKKLRFSCEEHAHAFICNARVEEAQEGSDLYEGSLAHNRLFATQAPQRVLAFHAEKITSQHEKP